MKTIDQRLKALETAQEAGLKPMPIIVPEDTSDEKLERLKRNGRAVFRSGDPAIVDEFV